MIFLLDNTIGNGIFWQGNSAKRDKELEWKKLRGLIRLRWFREFRRFIRLRWFREFRGLRRFIRLRFHKSSSGRHNDSDGCVNPSSNSRFSAEKVLTHNFHLPSRKPQSTNYFTYNRILTGFQIEKLRVKTESKHTYNRAITISQIIR